jgi:hypothetical protein
MAGLWAFKSTKFFFYYLLAIVLVVGLPAVIFTLIVPTIVSNVITVYIMKVIGATWVGFALVYPMSIIQQRF